MSQPHRLSRLNKLDRVLRWVFVAFATLFLGGALLNATHIIPRSSLLGPGFRWSGPTCDVILSDGPNDPEGRSLKDYGIRRGVRTLRSMPKAVRAARRVCRREDGLESIYVRLSCPRGQGDVAQRTRKVACR